MLGSALGVIAATISLTSLACARGPSVQAASTKESAAGTATEQQTIVRFHLAVAPRSKVPIYVVLNDAEGQAGWLRVMHGANRVYLSERCDISDCGLPASVCG